MELKEAVWHISDFTEEIQRRYEEETTVKESVHYNTVDKWFRDLETKGIHYIQRVADKKVYDDLDVAIAIFIMEKRSQKWSLDAISNILSAHLEVRPFPDLKNDEALGLSEAQVMVEMGRKFEKMQKEFEERMIQEIDLKKKELEQQLLNRLPKPKSDEEIRAEKTDMMISTVRKRYEIEEKAIAEWNKLPLEQRVKKVGFFRKEEDLLKRDNFIRKYVKQTL
jgi:DNA-binding transcriptional regulator YhcF (GntR family)